MGFFSCFSFSIINNEVNAFMIERITTGSFMTNSYIISNDKNITIINEEVTELPSTLSLIASGPLTSDDFANNIKSSFLLQ